LLPDATVLTAGGGPPGPVVNLNAEIYRPPYLFERDGSGMLADHPRILGVGDVQWGGSFDVDLSRPDAITKVALVRTGSVTHSFDMDQRYMALSFTQSGSTVRVRAPESRNIAPPGQYMLFVFDDAGVLPRSSNSAQLRSQPGRRCRPAASPSPRSRPDAGWPLRSSSSSGARPWWRSALHRAATVGHGAGPQGNGERL
jgi:hypothetical protein